MKKYNIQNTRFLYEIFAVNDSKKNHTALECIMYHWWQNEFRKWPHE